MKNLAINKVSFQVKSMSHNAFYRAENESVRSNAKALISGYDELITTPQLFTTDELLGSKEPKTIEIVLSAKGVIPNTNFLNIWVGQQLLTGTIVSEENQTITGYVKNPPSPKDTILLEYPNGEKKEFQIPIS